MRSFRYCTWLFLALQVTEMRAQQALPVVEPSSLSVFDIDAGLPISCVSDGMVDPYGQLWVNPCSNRDEYRTVSFFKFDGMQSTFVPWKDGAEILKRQAVLSGFTPLGALFGYFRDSGTCFVFDPNTQESHYYTLKTSDARVMSCGITKAYGIIVHALSATHHQVYRIDQQEVQLLTAFQRLDLEHPRDQRSRPLSSLLTETDLWIVNLGDKGNPSSANTTQSRLGVLTRVSLKNCQTSNYPLESLLGKRLSPPSQNSNYWVIAPGRQDTILIYLDGGNAFFKLAAGNGSVQAMDMFQDAAFNQPSEFELFDSDLNIIKDQSGNILFFRRYKFGFVGRLQDKNGKVYDYAPVLNAVQKKSRYSGSNIFAVHGKDFFQQAYFFTAGGLAVAEMKPAGAITTCLENIPIRAINETRSGKYLCYPESAMPISLFQPRITLEPELLKPISVPCLAPNARFAGPRHLVDIITDADGNFWVPFDGQLVRFRENGDCASFFVGKDFMRFAFADKTTVVLAAESRFFTYNIPKKRLTALPDNGQPVKINGAVNAICVAKDSSIWVAALDGLHHFDLKTGAYHRVGQQEGFLDERMMCIEEGKDGRLWVGTYGGGLHIYNPQSKAITIIDQKKGLSNNIVVGILTDDSGMRWVSTYEGITLISNTGEVLSRLYKEDGLSTNEFNRYSCYKSHSGALLFGSISGINIIHPKAFKARVLGREPVRIFLTRYSYYDAAGDSLVTKTNWSSQMQTITLPAAHRTLGLRFALSSLVQMKENNFAYKLEGSDIQNFNDWIYVGTNNELNLQNLPAGEYRVLIRGCDYRGNWTTEPLDIPIRAADFFYRQSWFILLCLFAILGPSFLWILRQKQKRRHLEKTLQERTTEIMRTQDQLVVQEKFASLGQLTAGIAHEIKNPLNFINNFAEDTSDLVDMVITELEKANHAAGSPPNKRLMQYLENMKQYALTIKSSGGTADRIVRSLMDHARGTSEQMQFLDLNHLIEETAHLAISGFRAGHTDFVIDLNTDYEPNTGQLFGSPLNLARAFLNILNNACYAMHEKQQQDSTFKPMLLIQTRLKKKYVEIRIRDNGTGISPEIKKEIFTPFFTTKPTSEGNTGLGLSICHDIVVTEHSGQMTVESEPGVYTEFFLKLPVNNKIS